MRNCESELQELMRQIDVMIQSKKSEWEREKLALTTRLEAKIREVQLGKNNLHQKHQEVSEVLNYFPFLVFIFSSTFIKHCFMYRLLMYRTDAKVQTLVIRHLDGLVVESSSASLKISGSIPCWETFFGQICKSIIPAGRSDSGPLYKGLC